ncbi:MAG: AAA family ATPase, partial [Promethearchaeota archaeon]
ADEIPQDVLDKLEVHNGDFLEALKEIQPSAVREVFIEVPDVKWSDIGGLDTAKQELKEVVEWPLKNPESFRRLGITPPKGVLVFGPPGCGKTLLARAVATESEANFISVKGPELISKWVGESEKAIREVFRKARTAAPAIIFFDEIDALAPTRGAGDGPGAVHNQRVISQLLTEMDGLESMKDIVVIAATNRPELIDKALLRTGRFDRFVYVDAPDAASRKAIFEIYTVDMPVADEVKDKIDKLVEMTEHYTGGDIEAICREAGMRAMRETQKEDFSWDDFKGVTWENFEEAVAAVHSSVTKEMLDRYRKMDQTLRRTTEVDSATHSMFA